MQGQVSNLNFMVPGDDSNLLQKARSCKEVEEVNFDEEEEEK